MIDIAIIKENYSRMRDEELILLSQNDGKDLSSEATTALYEEFLKRKLDITIFSSLRAHKIAEHQRHIENVQAAKEQEFAANVWAYCFEAKSEGKTDEEIFHGLIEFGLDQEQSINVINSIENRAIEIEKDYDNEQLSGGIICAIGILVTIATYSSALSGGTYVIAWGAILFGGIRFFSGLNNKSKFSKVLRNIKEQKQDQITT
jgi:hypothetical protein